MSPTPKSPPQGRTPRIVHSQARCKYPSAPFADGRLPMRGPQCQNILPPRQSVGSPMRGVTRRHAEERAVARFPARLGTACSRTRRTAGGVSSTIRSFTPARTPDARSVQGPLDCPVFHARADAREWTTSAREARASSCVAMTTHAPAFAARSSRPVTMRRLSGSREAVGSSAKT